MGLDDLAAAQIVHIGAIGVDRLRRQITEKRVTGIVQVCTLSP